MRRIDIKGVRVDCQRHRIRRLDDEIGTVLQLLIGQLAQLDQLLRGKMLRQLPGKDASATIALPQILHSISMYRLQPIALAVIRILLIEIHTGSRRCRAPLKAPGIRRGRAQIQDILLSFKVRHILLLVLLDRVLGAAEIILEIKIVDRLIVPVNRCL